MNEAKLHQLVGQTSTPAVFITPFINGLNVKLSFVLSPTLNLTAAGFTEQRPVSGRQKTALR